MTRKDYVAIAEVLRSQRAFCNTENAVYVWQGVAQHMADALAADNPRFDRTRFMDAAGFWVR